jgi:hypothetical protein
MTLASDKEFLVGAIRSATLRARLVANELDTIGIALNRDLVDCGTAISWLKDESLLDHVLRPEQQQ